MEIKTCEEYVLNELDRTQKELEEVKKELEKTRIEKASLKTSLSLQEDDMFDCIQCLKFLYDNVKKYISISNSNGIDSLELINCYITLKPEWLEQKDVEKIKKYVKILELVDSKEKEETINKLKDVIEEYEQQQELEWEDR